MDLEVKTLDELSLETVRQSQAELTQLVLERHPDLDLTTGGVFHDLIAYFAGGIAGGINQEKISRYLHARSLLTLSDSSDTVDDELVDHVLSNYLITRQTGNTASGNVSIVLSSDTTVVLPRGLEFAAGNLLFSLPQAYTARPSTSVVPLSELDRRLVARADGTFIFDVPAVATATGTAHNIPRGTRMVPKTNPDKFVVAFAAADFTGGTLTESNSDLLSRVRLGVTSQGLSGRLNMLATLKAQATFASVLHYQFVGYGNPELFRATHSLLPVTLPGYVDIYARTAATPSRVLLTKTATYVANDTVGTVWQCSLTRDDLPGFYEVLQVVRQGRDTANETGAVNIVTQRGLDTTNTTGSFTPDIQNAVEAAFTQYQTAVIQFTDTEPYTETLEADVTTASFDLVVTGMPLIAELQNFCNSRDYRPLGGDILVRAAIPCFLQVACVVNCTTVADVPTVAIQQALADAVNSLDYPRRLHVATLAAVIQQQLGTNQNVADIQLVGRILLPTGESQYISSDDVLELPNRADIGATKNTIAFVLLPDDVVVTAVPRATDEVVL